jgi:hypothetical protein
MTTPITIGGPQIIILLLLVAGLGLLISSAMNLAGKGKVYVDDTGQKYHRRHGHKRGIGGIFLIIVAVSLIWLAGLVQTYVGLDSKIRVAQVRASKISNQAHTINVELIQFDKTGKQISDDSYEVAGDRWLLQGDILKFPSWVNILGLHSGYKLTRLQGQYDSISDENTQKHQAIELNGGDGSFFQTVYQQAWSSPFVEAAYGNAVIEPADGHTYNVVVNQSGLEADPAR